MRRILCVAVAAALLLTGARSDAQESTVWIDNDVAVGSGSWAVQATAGGGAFHGELDGKEVIRRYDHLVSVGGGAALNLTSANPVGGVTLTGDDTVFSKGSFTGPNGIINWEATSSIASQALVYETALLFTCAQGFGDVRLIQYLDQDIVGGNFYWQEYLRVLGDTPGYDFELKTFELNYAGTTQAFGDISGMSFIGWRADSYDPLGKDILYGTLPDFPAGGFVDFPLIAGTDPPEYGPGDISAAFAFAFNPTATSAGVVLALGGIPEGQLEPNGPEPPDGVIPEPASLVVWCLMGLCGLPAAYHRRRRQSA